VTFCESCNKYLGSLTEYVDDVLMWLPSDTRLHKHADQRVREYLIDMRLELAAHKKKLFT